MNEVRISQWATAVFALTAIAAVPFGFARAVAGAVAITLFGAGTLAMCVALVIAAGRSRTAQIEIGGLFFLTGTAAPADVRRSLLVCLLAQVAVGLATAGARPFTSSALGVLVPIAGLGLMGLWGARHGTFPERVAG